MRYLMCLLAFGLSLSAARAQPAAPRVSIESVGWLQGCWQSGSADPVVEEYWMPPRAKSMLGMGRTVRGGTLAEYESVLIQEQDGRLAYRAQPSGQPGAVFLASTATDSEVVFENPQHDFPQQVGYRRDGADGLVGWIAGTRGGQPRRVEFPYRRVACPLSVR